MTVLSVQEKAAVPDIAQKQQRAIEMGDYQGKWESFDGVRFEPYSPAAGVVVRGLRLTADTRDEVARQSGSLLRERLNRYGFLSFEPGTVSAEDFIHLVTLFGDVDYTGTPYTPVAKESGRLNTIDSKVKKTRMNFIWHVDQAFRPEPPRYTSLFAKVVPPAGGDTLFANGTAAYELLDPLFAQYLETLTAIHDVETQGFLTLAYQDAGELAAQRAKNPPIEVPLIRTHPETGRKQVFANELYTQRIVGVSRHVSDHLLSILFDLLKSPEVQARYRWQEGAALIWDNRVVQHRGVGDYGQGHRVLHRAVIQ